MAVATKEELTDLARRVDRIHRSAGVPADDLPAGFGGTVEGCWCGGKGGRDEKYLPPVEGIRMTPTYAEYCVCGAGQRLASLEQKLIEGVWRLRDQEELARMWKGSGVPPHYEGFTSETFPVSPATQPVLDRLWGSDDDPDLRFWTTEDDHWLYLYGAYGTGKTGLAVAMLRFKLEYALGENNDQYRQYRALFITVPDLLARLRQSYDATRGSGGASEAELMESLYDVPLLVLDDLGAERATDWAVERLFSVINRRHDWHRQTIITSNLKPKELARHLGERILWRILEMCRTGDEEGAYYVIEVNGPNLRERRRSVA